MTSKTDSANPVSIEFKPSNLSWDELLELDEEQDNLVMDSQNNVDNLDSSKENVKTNDSKSKKNTQTNNHSTKKYNGESWNKAKTHLNKNETNRNNTISADIINEQLLSCSPSALPELLSQITLTLNKRISDKYYKVLILEDFPQDSNIQELSHQLFKTNDQVDIKVQSEHCALIKHNKGEQIIQDSTQSNQIHHSNSHHKDKKHVHHRQSKYKHKYKNDIDSDDIKSDKTIHSQSHHHNPPSKLGSSPPKSTSKPSEKSTQSPLNQSKITENNQKDLGFINGSDIPRSKPKIDMNPTRRLIHHALGVRLTPPPSPKTE